MQQEKKASCTSPVFLALLLCIYALQVVHPLFAYPTFILLMGAQVTALNKEVEALQRHKEILKTNLNKAEEEVKLLFEENRALDEANKRLMRLLEKEQKHRSERKHSASNSTKQKRKSSSLKETSPVGLAIDFNNADESRQPLSPLQPNSPDCRVHKK